MRIPLSLALLAPLIAAAPVVAQEQQFVDLGSCALESGAELLDCRVGYRTFGELSGARDNAVLIPSWYGGSTAEWVDLQAALLGEDHDYFVILVDALANGVSVSPSNSEAQPGEAFPAITTRDMVRSQHRLVTEVLGLDGLHAVMGVSMGGMQTFEWSVLYPGFAKKLVPIAGSPKLGGHDVALWEAYKRLLDWGAECACAEARELTTAVMLLNSTTSDQDGADLAGDTVTARVAASSASIDPGTALNLIRQADAMIATDVTRAFDGEWAAAAAAVEAEMLIIAESSDHVVTPRTGMVFAEHLGAKATPVLFETGCGHGLPGCEMFRVGALVRDFLRREP